MRWLRDEEGEDGRWCWERTQAMVSRIEGMVQGNRARGDRRQETEGGGGLRQRIWLEWGMAVAQEVGEKGRVVVTMMRRGRKKVLQW
ncbi:hypothetical protein ACH5RR_036622 [Cinchona calisaya]|uniref:RdRp catalytic domain-containing protein n=1 Tax=Cinchona calisaya TaxID=153742 RepID=A0ABD2Y970_9GENT